MRFLRPVSGPVWESLEAGPGAGPGASPGASPGADPGASPGLSLIIRYIPVKRPYEPIVPHNSSNMRQTGLRISTRYSTPPGTHQLPHPGYTPPLTVTAVHVLGMLSAVVNMVVGLRSVVQLTCRAH